MVVVSSRYQLHEHVFSKHPQDEQVDASSPRLGGSTVGTVIDPFDSTPKQAEDGQVEEEEDVDSTLVGTESDSYDSTPEQAEEGQDKEEESRGSDSISQSVPKPRSCPTAECRRAATTGGGAGCAAPPGCKIPADI